VKLNVALQAEAWRNLSHAAVEAFDRLLIGQAITESGRRMTADAHLGQYGGRIFTV
jgi:PIN domain nuclease of toxin-antitoxin system